MGELNKNQNLKTITLKEMFSDDQLHELLKCVSAGSFGDWSHLKSFLKRDDIEKHLLSIGILSDYLFYFLQNRVFESAQEGMKN